MSTFTVTRELRNKTKVYFFKDDKSCLQYLSFNIECFITPNGRRYVYLPNTNVWLSEQSSRVDNFIFITFPVSVYTDRLNALRNKIILEENGEEIFGKVFTFNRRFAYEGLPELSNEIVKCLFDLYLV